MAAIILGAGLVAGIVEHPVAVPAAEVGLVLGSQKGAGVVVEPPGQPLVAGVLEVHDDVLVSAEEVVGKGLAGLVGHAEQAETGARLDPGEVEAHEDGGRAGAVEAVVVIEDVAVHAASARLGPVRRAGLPPAGNAGWLYQSHPLQTSTFPALSRGFPGARHPARGRPCRRSGAVECRQDYRTLPRPCRGNPCGCPVVPVHPATAAHGAPTRDAPTVSVGSAG